MDDILGVVFVNLSGHLVCIKEHRDRTNHLVIFLALVGQKILRRVGNTGVLTADKSIHSILYKDITDYSINICSFISKQGYQQNVAMAVGIKMLSVTASSEVSVCSIN